MTSIVIVEKSGAIKDFKFKKFNFNDLYKKCSYRKSAGFQVQASCIVNSQITIEVWGRKDKEINKNKYIFPSPLSNTIYYGNCALIAMKNNNITDLDCELWKQYCIKLKTNNNTINSNDGDENDGDENDGDEDEDEEDIEDVEEDVEDEDIEDEDIEDEDDDLNVTKLCTPKKNIKNIKNIKNKNKQIEKLNNQISELKFDEDKYDIKSELSEEIYSYSSDEY